MTHIHNMTVSISVQNLSVRYTNGHHALFDMNFSLTGGTTCALVGVNGSGKSTLFKSIMGLIKPQSGQILLCGLPIDTALKQNLVAYVPQSEEVDWQFPVSVYDVVMMGRYGYMNFLRMPKAGDRQRVDDAMARVDILHLKDRQISELSGGQKKRVFLARSLAQQSKIILLDEPFTGVDVKTEKAIMALLDDLRSEGHLILISPHNLGTIPEFCDQVVMINRTVQPKTLLLSKIWKRYLVACYDKFVWQVRTYMMMMTAVRLRFWQMMKCLRCFMGCMMRHPSIITEIKPYR